MLGYYSAGSFFGLVQVSATCDRTFRFDTRARCAGETHAIEPALVSVCYRPRTAELMVPQAFRPLSWFELPNHMRECLAVLGCDDSTWEDGEYYPACLKSLERVRSCSLGSLF